MSNTHPRDRFDEVPATEARVGAHRRPPAPHARAVALAWAALATGVIVLLGFIGLLVIDDRVQFTDVFTPPTATAEATPTAAAIVVRSLTSTPMMSRRLVNITNGISANGIPKERTT